MRELFGLLVMVCVGQAAVKLLPPRGLKPMVALSPEAYCVLE
ncbi:MAG: hypothetical protein ACI8W8_003086 [Rhodothermales bacterium]|jgi:hypothetical protein